MVGQQKDGFDPYVKSVALFSSDPTRVKGGSTQNPD